MQDEAQVVARARALAYRGDSGRLAAWFEAPARLGAADLACVVEEEGWILGVEGVSAHAGRPRPRRTGPLPDLLP